MPTHASRPLPTETEVIAAVWMLLAEHPDRRPVVTDVAALLGYGERTLRAVWYKTGREPLRSVIAFGCSLRAAWLVHMNGEKAMSAVLDSGHRSPWVLNKQLKRRCGVTLQDCRRCLPEPFDWDNLYAACAILEERTNGVRQSERDGLRA